jgi:chaperonin GroES
VPEPATTAAGNGRRAGDETGGERADPQVDQAGGAGAGRAGDKLAIKMLNDRVMVRVDPGEGERTSSGGIVIPATAQLSRRLAWAEVVAIGPNVRAMQVGDHVLFNPEDRYEVEVRGDDYIILRERDVHAVAASRLGEASTGLYL